jgi:hypothetical protein
MILVKATKDSEAGFIEVDYVLGKTSLKVVMNRRNNVAGSRTNTAYHGRSFPQF